MVAATAALVSWTKRLSAGGATMMSMLGSLAALIACQGIGNVLHVLLGVPVPGPVLGIGLLLSGLVVWTRYAGSVPAVPAADTLLSYLSLFFVPPGVAMVMQLSQLGPLWPSMLLALVGSSVMTLIVAGRVTQALLSRENVSTVQRGRVITP